MSHKWHYFNKEDELCYYEPFYYPEVSRIYSTACGMPSSRVTRHTEFKGRVNCLRCIKALVREDKQKLEGTQNV